MQTIANGTATSDTACKCNGDAGYRAVSASRVNGQFRIADCEKQEPLPDANGELFSKIPCCPAESRFAT